MEFIAMSNLPANVTPEFSPLLPVGQLFPDSGVTIHQTAQGATLEPDYWHFFDSDLALRQLDLHISALESDKHERLTRQVYERDIAKFIAWYCVRHHAKELRLTPFFSQDTLSEYIAYLTRQKLSNKTVNRYLASVRLYLKFLAKQEPEFNPPKPLHVMADPASFAAFQGYTMEIQYKIGRKVRQLRDLADQKGLPNPPASDDDNLADKALTEEDILKIFASFGGELGDLRDKAIWMIAAYTGLRVSEIGRLSLACFKRKTSRTYALTVRGKRGNKLSVPCDYRAWKAVKKYVTAFNKIAEKLGKAIIGKADPLWRQIDRYNRPTNQSKGISRTALWLVFHDRSELVLGEACHPHMLRHSAGTNLTERKMAMPLIQRLLRHANITTTAKYSNGRTNWDLLNPTTHGYLLSA